MDITNIRNIIIGDSVAYQKDGIYYESVVINDGYIKPNAIHVFYLKILWNSEDGDVDKLNIVTEVKAKWIYDKLNVSKIHETIIGRHRMKQTFKKKNKRNRSIGTRIWKT